MELEPGPGPGSLTRPCSKCRARETTLESRSHAVCKDCFMNFVAAKCIKQIGLLGKETRPPPPASGGPPTETRRYLLGLSLGVSSTVLLHLLNENIEFQLAKGRNAPFELVVIHVDTSLFLPDQNGQSRLAPALDAYRQRYPRFTFHCIPLSSTLDLSSTNPDDIDWSSLPFRSPFSQRQGSSDSEPSPPQPSIDDTEKTLQTLLASLPSAASRADIVRLLTRHALVSQAHQHGCQALLLGHSTTALAELTLAEAAKGRGFSLPWLVRDGPSPTDDDEDDDDFSSSIPDDHTATASVNPTSNHAGGGKDRGRRRRLLIYHPLRELQRRELATYASLTEPALTPLLGLASPSLDNSNSSNNRIVSHKDLSIEEVMARYFGEVEAEYPSVIANVVRTAGKLVPREVTEHEGDNNDDDEDDYEDDGETAGGEGSKKKRREGRCGLCRMPLDLAGDERWRGELGEKKEISLQGRKGKSRLCYGCERSTAG